MRNYSLQTRSLIYRIRANAEFWHSPWLSQPPLRLMLAINTYIMHICSSLWTYEAIVPAENLVEQPEFYNSGKASTRLALHPIAEIPTDWSLNYKCTYKKE